MRPMRLRRGAVAFLRSVVGGRACVNPPKKMPLLSITFIKEVLRITLVSNRVANLIAQSAVLWPLRFNFLT